MITIPAAGPIYVVDDQESDLMIIKIVLQRSKLSNPIVQLQSGEEAVALLQKALVGEAEPPVLILLDINMPGMTGFDVLRWIRARDKFADVPVVSMLTSSDATRDADESTSLGANTFLTKPSGLNEFVEMFDREFTNV